MHSGVFSSIINAMMVTRTRKIHLHPRLETAAALLNALPENAVVADIGCDHGRLACALLQRNETWRCIASDVSAPSLEKARRLSAYIVGEGRIDIRLGDGLTVLCRGEADAVVLCGMGGERIVELLDAADSPLMGARLAVMQPMRGVEELRAYLYTSGYRILDDRVTEEAGRLYQILSAAPPCTDGERDTWPADFPVGCFSLGYRAFERRDPLCRTLARQQLLQTQKRLKTAANTGGEPVLRRKEAELLTILERWEH